MATIKHLTSKNSNYAAAESYLTFQHNEYTGLPILDEKGRPKLRDSYLLDTLECGESSFAMACLIANRKYGKNGGREDVKTHHIWRHPPKRMLIYSCAARTAGHTKYIISFDPKDAVENGLTMERAQVLGLQFCKNNFPGHPAIVCTHPDGHNSAGNIHVHIVIGSLRVRTVERQPFMDKPCDWEAGKKHRCTSAMLRHLRVAVMEMCEQADLNQINLLEAQGDHVSEREYWAQRRGQRRLDHANAKLAIEGQQPTQTVYQTELDKLRKQIYSVLNKATTFEEFSALLMQEHGIAVKESRGRLSYCPPGRTKFITAKKLSKKLEKEQVLTALSQNIQLAAIIQPSCEQKPDKIRKLVDIQAKAAAGKGIGYERWAKKFNLKRWSQTLCLLQEKKLLSEDALNQRIAELKTRHDDALAVVKDMDARMVSLKELRGHLVVYRQYKPLAQKLQTVRNPAKFKEQHRAELAVYEASCAYFKANGLRTLPDLKKLDAEYQTLSSEKNGFYTRYKKAQIELRELRTETYPPEWKTQLDRIHLQNGTYFLDERGFVPEKELCLNRLPVEYQPDAPAPTKWLEFLDGLLIPEDILTLQEYLGYLLIPSTKAQKMLVMTGKGGEGKSRIGLLLKKLFGEASHSESILRIETNRFASANLEYKLVMVDDDLNMVALPETRNIKSIVTAEDCLCIERKNKQAVQGLLYVRFICFGNGNLVAAHDDSDGFNRKDSRFTSIRNSIFAICNPTNVANDINVGLRWRRRILLSVRDRDPARHTRARTNKRTKAPAGAGAFCLPQIPVTAGCISG